MLESKCINREEKFDQPQVVLHNTEELEKEACLALALIERWGMVAGIPDGEDSSGRSKLRLSTPEELTERAFECAKLAFDKARYKGLMHEVGSLKDHT
jgi:hypothetical protein